jgi:RNA polymerase sigma-70 factor (ECF subfamily)
MDSKDEPMTTVSDNMLLERLGQGDVTSFETLFLRHYDRVYGLLFRLLGDRGEAEDVLQEVFLKLYYHPLRFDEENNVSAWLYRVATNMGYNAIRGRKRLDQRNSYLVPDASPDPADTVAQREAATKVRTALAKLNPRQVQLLLLRQMGLSYEELATACGIAPTSVGTLLARAGKAFRDVYKE